MTAAVVDDAGAGRELEQMRALFGELARYAKIPLPAIGAWGEYERTARTRLEQVAELCRAAAQGATLPLSVDACLSVARAVNLAPLDYEPEPAYAQRQTADQIDAAELAARPPRLHTVRPWIGSDEDGDCGCGLGAARCRAAEDGERYED